MSKKRVLIVFPDEWLQYSPSVQNLYSCFSESQETKLIYFDNGHFNNEGIVSSFKKIKVGKADAYLSRKTVGYKFYKLCRLFLSLFFCKLFDRKYDIVIAVDSAYVPAKLLFGNTIYFSLETEKDIYYRLGRRLGIRKMIIQSEERKEFMLGGNTDAEVFYIQNSPILKDRTILKEKSRKDILYMGNIEFGYGLEQFIDCVCGLDDQYSLTLKGIKNVKFYDHLQVKYADMLSGGKLRFDFNYVPQDEVIAYVSGFYIGITGYDLELAKKSFNYFSSPAGKLFNYYAAGIPVIGINIIGLKSVKDFKAGVLLNEVSPPEIEKAISEIEGNYNEMAHNCLLAAEHFDFKRGFDIFMRSMNGGKK